MALITFEMYKHAFFETVGIRWENEANRSVSENKNNNKKKNDSYYCWCTFFEKISNSSSYPDVNFIAPGVREQ